MKKIQMKLYIIVVTFMLSACESSGLSKVLDNADVLTSAVGLSENQVVAQSSAAVAEMDKKNKLAPANNKYSKRLNKIVKGLENYDGLELDFKVYLADQVNAFATPDGSVRVFSGLMDVMNDDQLLAVIGHEIGHVYNKHSLGQMRKSFATNVGFRVLSAVGGNAAKLSNSELGKMMNGFLNARFSQSDELEADAFAVKFLKEKGKNPLAMKESIEVFQKLYGNSADFFSTHPSNPKRIENIEKEVQEL